MLIVGLLTFKRELTREQRNAAAQRRARWKPPLGVTPVAEYWLQGSPYVVVVFETESAPAILGTFANWDDVFDIQVFPAVTAEDGLRVLQQAGIIRRRGRPPKALTQQAAAPAPVQPRRRGRPARRRRAAAPTRAVRRGRGRPRRGPAAASVSPVPAVRRRRGRPRRVPPAPPAPPAPAAPTSEQPGTAPAP